MTTTQNPIETTPIRTWTYDGKTYRFPVKACGRCGGSGRYSYCPQYGDRCFGCSGTGVAVVGGKVAAAQAHYLQAVRDYSHTTGDRLAVGDRISVHAETGRPAGRSTNGKPQAGTEWADVAGIVIHYDEPMGWSVRDGERVETGWMATFTLADGRTARCQTNMLIARYTPTSKTADLVREAQAMIPAAWIRKADPIA